MNDSVQQDRVDRRFYPLRIKLLLLLASSMTVMAGITLAPILPAMQASFATTEQAAYYVKFMLVVPALFMVIGLPIAQFIGDRVGYYRLLFSSLLVFGLAGSSGLVLYQFEHLLMGRAVLGLANGSIMTSVMALSQKKYDDAQQASFLNLQTICLGLSSAIFLVGSGLFARTNWYFAFLLYWLAFLVLPLIPTSTHEVTFPQRSSDRSSRRLSIESSAQNRSAWGSVLFVFIVALFMQAIFYLIPIQLPFYLVQFMQADAFLSGVAIALCILVSLLTTLCYRWIKYRLDCITVLILTLGFMGAGYGVIGVSTSYDQVLAGLVLVGIGFGLLLPNLMTWLDRIVVVRSRHYAQSGLTTFLLLGQVLSPAISQPLSEYTGLNSIYSFAGGLLLFLALIFAGTKRQLTHLTHQVVSIESNRIYSHVK